MLHFSGLAFCTGPSPPGHFSIRHNGGSVSTYQVTGKDREVEFSGRRAPTGSDFFKKSAARQSKLDAPPSGANTQFSDATAFTIFSLRRRNRFTFLRAHTHRILLPGMLLITIQLRCSFVDYPGSIQEVNCRPLLLVSLVVPIGYAGQRYSDFCYIRSEPHSVTALYEKTQFEAKKQASFCLIGNIA